jgi:hypothetical protein
MHILRVCFPGEDKYEKPLDVFVNVKRIRMRRPVAGIGRRDRNAPGTSRLLNVSFGLN